jgi:hypothetical protein
MKEVGQKVKSFEDWKREMLKLVEKAVSEKRFTFIWLFYWSWMHHCYEYPPG